MRGDPSDERLADRTMALIRGLSAIGGDDPSPGTPLSAIGFDSLAFVELATALQDELGVELDRADLHAERTVGDVVDAVAAARSSSSTSAPGPASAALPRGLGRLQSLSNVVGGWALRWWFGLEVLGAERVPPSGPAVLAMNHESALDIPIAVVASPRPVTFMAKKELYKNAFVARALHELGGFRVERDRFDLRAVRIALAVIARGEVLGMYPEGTRSPGTLLPFLHGAAWMALRTGAPIVPCSISGTERARGARRPGRVRVRVSFAPPLEVERIDEPRKRRLAAAELTAEVRRAIEDGLGRRVA